MGSEDTMGMGTAYHVPILCPYIKSSERGSPIGLPAPALVLWLNYPCAEGGPETTILETEYLDELAPLTPS